MEVNNWIMLSKTHFALDHENGEKEQGRKESTPESTCLRLK